MDIVAHNTQCNKYLQIPNNIMDLVKNSNAKTLIIRSSLGTGKTRSIFEIADNFEHVVVISSRKTYSYNIANQYGYNLYMDMDKKNIQIKHQKKLVIQLDSFDRIIDSDVIDLIIFDEFCSCLTHACGN